MWGSKLEKYLLIINLDNNNCVMFVLEGFSEGHALESAYYNVKPIVYCSKDKEVELTKEQLKELISKVRDNKVSYKLLKGVTLS